MELHSTLDPTPRVSSTQDLLQLMLDCHERIRRFCSLAQRLGEMRDASDEELTACAEQLLAFFTMGLPLHLDDEDHSLTPRLLERGVPRPVVRSLWEMGRAHERLEARVDALTSLWAEVRATPECHARLAPLLTEDARRVTALVEALLTLKEEFLYPAARAWLTPDDLEALAVEMRVRRRRLP